VDPQTRKRIFPGFPPGSEALPGNWDTWIVGAKSIQSQFAQEFFANFVTGDPNWNYRSFNWATDPAKTDAAIGSLINSDNPDLKDFAAHGGKLILYHGWDDAAITPLSSIQYFQDIQKALGVAQARRFVRLFMAPGMMHCSGGPGPDNFDAISAIEKWREKDQAPETLIAARYANPQAVMLGMPKGTPESTRPLCAYPNVAHWNGHGSTDEAKNYVCRAGSR
jgi:feruloyl esterase